MSLPPPSSVPSSPPSPPPGTPRADDREFDVPRWLLVGLALLVAVAAVVSVVEVRKLLGSDEPEGPAHPEAWDARVLPLAEQVEELRGLEFKHPVYVDFLPDAEFREKVTEDEEDLDDETREELEQATGFLRAVGAIEGDLDLFEAVNDLTGGGIIGYYSFEDERITMRGTKLTWAVRSTLVHELTHALQDQHFNLGATKERMADDEDDNPSSMAYDALVEGDARRIESAWAATLKPAQRRALRRQEQAQSDGADTDLADVPEFLTTLMGAPYGLGETLLRAAGDRNAAVDRLFRDPPSSEEHLLDPWTLLADEQDQAHVESPSLPEGAEEVESSTFGALGWYLVLAERIPLAEALRAADGWGGDAYVHYELDGRQCVRVDYVADTSRDLREMQAAVRAWVAQTPRSAQVSVSDDVLRFQSCDPGGRSKVGEQRSQEALQLAMMRIVITGDLIDEGLGRSRARCFGRGLVEVFTPRELQLQQLDADQQRRLGSVQQRCL